MIWKSAKELLNARPVGGGTEQCLNPEGCYSGW
jgi:hypothetical protein